MIENREYKSLNIRERIIKELFDIAKKIPLLIGLMPQTALSAEALVTHTEEAQLSKYGEFLHNWQDMRKMLFVGLGSRGFVYPQEYEPWISEVQDKITQDIIDKNLSGEINTQDEVTQYLWDHANEYLTAEEYQHQFLATDVLLDIGCQAQSENNYYFTGGMRFDMSGGIEGLEKTSLLVGTGWKSLRLESTIGLQDLNVTAGAQPTIRGKNGLVSLEPGFRLAYQRNFGEQLNGYGADFVLRLKLQTKPDSTLNTKIHE